MAVHGVPASITLAQALLESGNGNSRLAIEGNNHFGIKCHNDWSGKTIHEDDETRGECFRKYRDPRDSFDDHSVFLKRKRYAPLFELEVTDYKGWAKGLKQCGYATNPQYPQMLIRLIETHNLDRYDEMGMAWIKSNAIPERTGGEPRLAAHNKGRNNVQKKKGWDPDSPSSISLDANREVLQSGNHVRYTMVKPGDSIRKIADAFGMNVWQILKYNDLKKGDEVSEGQIIYLQPKRNSGTVKEYTVKPGDTFQGISQQFAIKLKKLYRKNQIEPGTPPKPGTTLRIG
jgi:LysM repeat protein